MESGNPVTKPDALAGVASIGVLGEDDNVMTFTWPRADGAGEKLSG
jgi:hypothetical protein